jgi:triosephosphate isomerase
MVSAMQQKLVVANFKMNLSTRVELDHWLSSFINAKRNIKLRHTKLILCPPALYLDKFVSRARDSFIDFGVQNCFWRDKGAYTGEISPTAAKAIEAEYVILGHSERRKYLGETDEIVAYKINAALKARLRPIVCVGENAEQKKSDQLMEVVISQLRNCLTQTSKGLVEEIIFCYEPVWAISANNPDHLPTANEIMGAKLLIKKYLTEVYGKNVAQRVKVIYGGSVDSKNLKEVCIDPGMDGVLVGSASLMPYEIVKVCQGIDE